MVKFILRTALFLMPVILVHLYTYFFYNPSQGDLLRVGYVHDGYPHTRLIKDPSIAHGLNFSKASQVPLKGHYDVLTIGDSFSEMDTFGYQNYLGKDKQISMLHIDQNIHNNDPLQLLSGLLKADFFDSVQVSYVILESVERLFCARGLRLDTATITSYADLCLKIDVSKKPHAPQPDDKFFSDRVMKFTRNNLLYRFADNALYSDVYQTALDRVHFSNNKDKLLFIYDDLENTELNNQIENVAVSNQILNSFCRQLKERNIQLIVLPAVDKYDFYYLHLENKGQYPQPVFFDHLRSLDKAYIFIDSKSILQQNSETHKDVYQYGDTHWSPGSSGIIASALYRIIRSRQAK